MLVCEEILPPFLSMGTLVTPLTRILGVVLLVVGLLGFVMSSPLLGIFEVDTIHNLIHVASGIVALAVAGNKGYATMYLIVFGIVYGLVAVLGYMNGSSILGIFGVNGADNALHTAIAAVCLIVGFGSKS